ncbi:hypothetical protein H9Q08_17440 [Chryseobacterium sp. PS-8]|uniref:Uncharacterized protein n=1 Tax=Chryseobacterium indicum TaxID=2766954 RepID=A0ABS9C921_9FLAO|nr:hypothetical protein [Chryseobacterium sp. PS-8]MCF2221073.1 hypothetical protein [Chryseobacterium sp. PS-8]
MSFIQSIFSKNNQNAKYSVEKEELQQRIDESTKDLEKMISNRWSFIRNPFKKFKLLEFHLAAVSFFYTQKVHYKSLCEHSVNKARSYRNKLLNYVLPQSESNYLETINKKALLEKELETKSFCLTHQMTFTRGAKAEEFISKARIHSMNCEMQEYKAKEELLKMRENTSGNHTKYSISNDPDYSEHVTDSNSLAASGETTTYSPDNGTVSSPNTNNGKYATSTSGTSAEELRNHTFPESRYDHIPAEPVKVHFTKPDEGPVRYVQQCQFYEAQVAYGRKWAKENFPVSQDNEEDHLLANAGEASEIPEISQTFLGSIGFWNLVVMELVVILAIAAEWLCYVKVLSLLYKINDGKEYLLGSVIVLFSKGMSFLIKEQVHQYFKELSPVFEIFKRKISRFFFIVLILGLLYTLCIGSVYYEINKEENLTRRYVLVSQNVMQWQDQMSQDGSADQDAAKELENSNRELNHIRKQLTKIQEHDTLKKWVVSLTNMMVLVFSSILFAMSFICGTAYSLRRKHEKSSFKALQLESKCKSIENLSGLFNAKAWKVFRLMGELQYLRRLEHEFRNSGETLYDPEAPLPIKRSVLPLNGKEKV